MGSESFTLVILYSFFSSKLIVGKEVIISLEIYFKGRFKGSIPQESYAVSPWNSHQQPIFLTIPW